MAAGEFSVMGYSIRLYNTLFTVHTSGTPSLSLRVGAIRFRNNNDAEGLKITVHSELHATVEIDQAFMRLIYNEPNNLNSEGNGQIEVSIKIEGETYPSWVTLVNSVPREVIFTAIAILNGDDYCEQYRVRRNSNGEIIRNNEDPGFENENVAGPALGSNGNEPSSNNGADKGGRRRRSTRRVRRYKKKGR